MSAESRADDVIRTERYIQERSISPAVHETVIPALTAWESLDHLLGGQRFRGVSWHDLPEPENLILNVDSASILVSTYGLQRLDTPASAVRLHLESQFELLYPLAGGEAVTVNTVDPLALCVPQWTDMLKGSLESTDDLVGQRLRVFGDAKIEIGGRVISPVVTRAGWYHQTDGGPLTYLVIKGVFAANGNNK